MPPHGDSMSDMDMATTTGAAAAASTSMAGMDMSGMDMSASSSNGSMSSMMAVFFESTTTPLYSTAWTPNSVAAYAGTCIFLVILAATARGLLAARSLLEARWLDAEMRRRYVVVAGKQGLAGRLSDESLPARDAADAAGKRSMVLSENGAEEHVTVVQRKGGPIARPWRLSTDPLRAILDTVIAGVGYLLMVAVMSMNTGYFLSVLAGVFLGSLVVGRYSAASEH